MFRDIQIVIITKFVVVSSVDVTSIGCSCAYRKLRETFSERYHQHSSKGNVQKEP